jgi:hypothetical protein
MMLLHWLGLTAERLFVAGLRALDRARYAPKSTVPPVPARTGATTREGFR